MNAISRLIYSVVLISICGTTFADDYRVTVTRKDANIYQILGKDMFIQTRYCYEYVYGEDSLLKLKGSYGSELLFLDSSGKCDVKAVYEKVEQEPGTYVVTVSHVDENWYEIMGSGLFIKTSMCLSIDLAAESILKLESQGFGTLKINSNNCMVEGIYGQLRI